MYKFKYCLHILFKPHTAQTLRLPPIRTKTKWQEYSSYTYWNLVNWIKCIVLILINRSNNGSQWSKFV